eukprot:7378157-Pyramimonas_sp.AAC.1
MRRAMGRQPRRGIAGALRLRWQLGDCRGLVDHAREIERRELTRYPAETWRDICARADAGDVSRKERGWKRRDCLVGRHRWRLGWGGGGPNDFEFARQWASFQRVGRGGQRSPRGGATTPARSHRP